MNGQVIRHYGVPGMKWGKRKSSASNKSSNVKKLSDAELRSRINRIQMERQYSQLTRSEKDKGRKIVTDILASAAKQTASQYASKYMTKGVDAIIRQAVGS